MDKNAWLIHGSTADYEISLRDGQYYIRYRVEKLKNEQFQPFVSERDPEKEALRILGNFILKKGLIAVVIGAGCIKLIELLKNQQKNNGGDILVFESDSVLYSGIKKNIANLYENTTVVTDENINQLADFVNKSNLESMLGYRILVHSRSYQLSSEFYNQMEDKFKSLFSIRLSDLLTRLEFEAKWILNGLVNLNTYKNAIPVNALFNQSTGENALLVSSGPSLRQSLPWIKNNQNRYFIACVDSAYRVLYRSGIKPHLIYTLDSQIFTYKHFQGLPEGEVGKFPVLCADLVSNPMVVRNWKGNIVMGITAHYTDTQRDVTPGCDYIEEEFFTQPCGDLQSGGSVATSLFDLLRNMNFKSITLIGQDLAFTNREIHSVGTHHTDIWLSKNINRLESVENINNKVLKKRHIVWSKSIQGRPLPEDYIFSIYRKWFEESIATVPMKVMNASFDGAKIMGTQKISIPDKNISKTSIEKLSNVLFKTQYTTVKNEKLKNFYNILTSRKYSEDNDFLNEVRFMDRIGKKYYIKYLRSEMRRKSGDVVESKNLNIMKREKIIFWNVLVKKLKKYSEFNK
ncbi:MAG: DUF115 domain-containing protein [Spirochaetia bacterium]|nr:DUF115 domain-containing protein [Spirochaetia bacterium]